ncbi:EthD family reductase [Amycolatopsis japonica]
MPDEGVYLLFGIYRWAGTTVAEFQNHLKQIHGPIARRFPGLLWYESFLNTQATDGWPSTSAPAPDAFAVMKFESEKAKNEIVNSAAWQEAQADSPGFIAHYDVFAVDRITWVPDEESREPFAPGREGTPR